MGADISVEAVAGKLNRVGYEAFILGLRQAKTAGNRNIELGHWIFQLIQKDRTDISLTADRFKVNRARLLADATAVVNGFRKNETEMPGTLDRGNDNPPSRHHASPRQSSTRNQEVESVLAAAGCPCSRNGREPLS